MALVVLDTLRKDQFDEHFDWVPGTTYNNAWSTGRRTTPAHASLFTGRYPSSIGVHSKQPHLLTEEPTLAAELQKTGYRTRGLSSNVYITDEFGYNKGFDNFHYVDPVSDFWVDALSSDMEGYSRYIAAVRAAVDADQRTAKLLKGGLRRKFGSWIPFLTESDWGAAKILENISSMEFNQQNEFLFLNFMETHAPYVAPSEYRSCEPQTPDAAVATVSGEGPETPKKVKQSYNDCARYLSDKYSEIFQVLEQHFDYIITLADHGECFGEEGIWGHCCGVYPELTHIPLSIYAGTDVPPPYRMDSPVNLLDVYRTIIDIGTEDTGRAPWISLIQQHDTVDRQIRTETIGMARLIPDRLDELGIARDTIEAFDSDFYGFPTISGYCYQTVLDGVACRGVSDDDTKRELSDFSINWEKKAENVEVSDSVAEELENLGYL